MSGNESSFSRLDYRRKNKRTRELVKPKRRFVVKAVLLSFCKPKTGKGYLKGRRAIV